MKRLFHLDSVSTKFCCCQQQKKNNLMRWVIHLTTLSTKLIGMLGLVLLLVNSYHPVVSAPSAAINKLGQLSAALDKADSTKSVDSTFSANLIIS